MSTFDAPSRESCAVRRERTNTPLQALVLLNDPQYLEAARYLAELTLRQDDLNQSDRIRFLFRRAMSRDVEKHELDVLAKELNANLDRFSKATSLRVEQAAV